MMNPYDEASDVLQCPECYEEETTEFYIDRETLHTLGCDCCKRPLSVEEAQQYVEDDYLFCPVCHERCDDIYIDKATKSVIGCDACVKIVSEVDYYMYYKE